MNEQRPKQKSFDLVPDYVEKDGVKHEFNGTLFVPLPGQSVPPPPHVIEEVNQMAADLGRAYEGVKRMRMNFFAAKKLMRRTQ